MPLIKIKISLRQALMSNNLPHQRLLLGLLRVYPVTVSLLSESKVAEVVVDVAKTCGDPAIADLAR